MNKKEKAERKLAGMILDKLLKYVDKDPQANLLKLISIVEKLSGGSFPEKNFKAMKNAISKGDGVYYDYAMSFLRDLDRGLLKKMALALGLGAGVNGTKAVRQNRDVYKCNIPFLILMDPTSACNCRCKGCWAAEYGHNVSLSYDEMASIVRQGKALGTHLYMFTGGEPLIKKKEILRLCEENPDCAFLAYTNATLIDDDFCKEVLRVGNLAFAISVEGTEESTDARRGSGSYQKAISAMKLLKKYGCLFGMSVCYTSENVSFVTSDDFLDTMISLGVKFGLYFSFMPVGHDAPVELIPTPEQREHMYKWLRKTRNGESGKPLFVMDFQDDGEYVGGCIAGGRNYFHINSAGDIEPCVFIHFSDSNIRTHTILEALRNPLFMSYYHNQPFNDNHLRPCPMLENPDYLRKMIKQTGAKSTDLENQEGVEHLCAKCDKFAAAWKEQADKLWAENNHPNPKTQYYRDTEQAMKEKLDDLVR